MRVLLHIALLACTVLFFTSCIAIPTENSQLKLAGIFQDNMVLQRGMKVPVWGTAVPGTTVEVQFKGQKKRTKANSIGRWLIKLSPLRASSTPSEMRITAHLDPRPLTLSSILVGEVWLCSGQSNMEMALNKSENGAAVAAKARHPNIRLFNVPHKSVAEPQPDCESKWQVCTPQTAAGFAAVAYYLGRDLHEKLDVPIGLIHSGWSGACAESLMPIECLAKNAKLKHIPTRWKKYKAEYPNKLKAYEAARKKWDRDKKGKLPRRPKHPDGPETSVGRLYNGMVHPLIPFAIRGVAFYQGENNVVNIEEYRDIFPLLIRKWRKLWGQGDFPFMFVQIANFGGHPEQPEDSPWAHLRDAQLSGLTQPNTYMTTAIDLGGEFHPRNKKDVGLRLALVAYSNVYGKRSFAWSGPMFKSMKIKGARAILSFDHIGGGLVIKGGGELQGFTIAGKDRIWGRANAVIEHSSVVVSSREVGKPVAVRYGWATNPRANLYNKAGLPTVPFRTDNWPATQSL